MRLSATLLLVALTSACAASQPNLPTPQLMPQSSPQFAPPDLPPSRASQPEIGPELTQATRYLFDISGTNPRLIATRSYRTVGVDSRDRGQQISMTAFDDQGRIVASASRPHPLQARSAGLNHGDLQFRASSGAILVDAVWPESLQIADVLVEVRDGPGADGRVRIR